MQPCDSRFLMTKYIKTFENTIPQLHWCIVLHGHDPQLHQSLATAMRVRAHSSAKTCRHTVQPQWKADQLKLVLVTKT